MSTKKDLVEAHSFSRRRLVTAFVSGAPGGREVEPSRPGRTIVGGVALGVLVLAGGAIAGVFSGRPPDDWLQPGLVVAEGRLYAITEESDDPELRPVVGPTSGLLIFGGEEEPASVSPEDVAQQRLGEDIGILGAPSYLPPVEELVDDGWVACTAAERGIRVDLSATPLARASEDGALVVRSEGYWLLAGGEVAGDTRDPHAFRYRLPTDGGARDQLLEELGLPQSTDVTPVSEEWLNLWEPKDDLSLASFDVGEVAPGAADEFFDGLDEPAGAGDVVDVAGQPYLVTEQGAARLGAFDAAVYEFVSGDGVQVLEADSLAGQAAGTPTPDGWPEEVPTAVDDTTPCAMLDPREAETPTVLVVDEPSEELDPSEVPPGLVDVSVEPGKGAYVLSGTFGVGDAGPEDTVTPFVIDPKGTRYQVEGAPAIVNLGYAEHPARVVPDSWMELLGCGVVLSRDAALGTPDGQDDASCSPTADD